MTLVKKDNNRWNILLQNVDDRNCASLLKWDDTKKVYYTDDELVLEKFNTAVKAVR